MDQSSFRRAGALHVGIIMDGNGRWAIGRGLPRTAGHAEGARAVRRTVEGAARLGVGTLTLYAFSADNWRRPSGEVGALMRLFRRYLAAETARCVDNGIRLTIVGRLVSVVIMTTLGLLGTSLDTTFVAVKDELQGAGGGTP